MPPRRALFFRSTLSSGNRVGSKRFCSGRTFSALYDPPFSSDMSMRGTSFSTTFCASSISRTT